MFEQEAVVPAEFMVPSLRIAIDNRLDNMESLRERMYRLSKLNDRRLMAQWATKVAQTRRKAWHDKHLKQTRFQLRQLVLKYNGRNKIKPGKIKVKWLRPYKVREVGDNGAIKLWTLDGQVIANSVNGSKLKTYHRRHGGSQANRQQGPKMVKFGPIVQNRK